MFNIFECLSPEYGKKEIYDGILNKYSLKNDINILWNPNAGKDFRSLIFSRKDSILPLNLDGKPDLYIYTCMNPTYWELIKKDEFVEFDGHCDLENAVELRFDDNKLKEHFYDIYNLVIDPAEHSNYAVKPFKDSQTIYKLKDYTIFLFDLNLSGEAGSVPMLYFIWDSLTFFKAFVLNKGLEVKYLIMSGGGSYYEPSVTFLIYFLGLMKTKYLLTDYFEDKFKNKLKKMILADDNLNNIFLSKDNIIPEEITKIGETFRKKRYGIKYDEYFNIYDIEYSDSDSNYYSKDLDGKIDCIINKLKR